MGGKFGGESQETFDKGYKRLILISCQKFYERRSHNSNPQKMDFYKLMVRFLFIFLAISMVESTPFWRKFGRSGSSNVQPRRSKQSSGVNIFIV